MVTERVIHYSPEGESNETDHNIHQLSEDYPVLFPDSEWDTNGVNIPLEEFYYRGLDEGSISYCSHDHSSLESTLEFWIHEKLEGCEIEKSLRYTTRLSESTDDSKIEVRIRERLSIMVYCNANDKYLVLKNPKEEETIIIPLVKSDDPQNFNYFYKSPGQEGNKQWEEIREFLKNSLGYYVNHLNILYDREKRLEINAVLD
jgi:hypothetical protein